MHLSRANNTQQITNITHIILNHIHSLHTHLKSYIIPQFDIESSNVIHNHYTISNLIYPPPDSHFCRFKLRNQRILRESATILHQPRKSQIWVKNGKSAQKVNGISVSETPKIGERPYPRQFHPVEIRGKIGKIHGKPPKSQGNQA